MPSTATAQEVRQAIQELASEATAQRADRGRYAAAPLDSQRAPQLEPVRHGGFHRPRADLRAHAHRRRCWWPSWARRIARDERDGRRAAAALAWPARWSTWASRWPGRVPVNLNFTAGRGGDGGGDRALRDPHGGHVAACSWPRRSSKPRRAWSIIEDILAARAVRRATACVRCWPRASPRRVCSRHGARPIRSRR